MGRSMKEITSEELSSLNGKEGKPVSISFQGKIYDVSKSPLWSKGIHMNRHPSGKDLSGEIAAAPPGPEGLGAVSSNWDSEESSTRGTGVSSSHPPKSPPKIPHGETTSPSHDRPLSHCPFNGFVSLHSSPFPLPKPFL